MKKTITTLALAATVLLAAAPNAFATHEDPSQDTAGAGTDVCRPGPTEGHELIGSWVPMTQAEFALEVFGDATPPENFGDATWAFCDKNRDGTLCVMATVPSPYGYTLLDNRPFR
jgi:hypothetical protein